jgi:DNA-binding NarL/FixJ family response regulator
MTDESAQRIRVLLVDDDALVRAGLTMMLDGAHGIEVVGEAADGAEVPAAVDAHAPDVVLMDLRMPGGGQFGDVGLAVAPGGDLLGAAVLGQVVRYPVLDVIPHPDGLD